MRAGPRIPHSEKVERAEERAFLLLLLFKPWRNVADLKSCDEDWSTALRRFERQCGK
jgi:hypothetical protein